MRWLACLSVAFALLLSACSRLDPPEKSGELVVAVRADSVFYQEASGEEQASGIEHDLAQAFADELRVKVRFIPARDTTELIDLVRSRKVHFAAAAPALGGVADIRSTPPLRESRGLLVQHADSTPLDDIESLAGHSVEVLPGAPELQSIRQLQAQLAITEVPEASEIDLLARVASRRSDLAAVDRAHYDVAVNFYPDLAIARELPEKVAYVWAFHAKDVALQAKAEDFIARIRGDGRLSRLHDRYFGHIKRVGANNMAQFLQLMQTRLPHFRREFHQAQLLTGLDWRLLAALAYQESNWDPLATSPTGVRGMMMLTEDTADRLRVSNRLDPHQSILAGARYLADLIEAMPEEAEDPDRNWLALAAYNIGQGHFNGAVAIAKGLKRDPASWYEMKQVLPLLSRPQYYNRLKSGKARGGEAVIMVENIRNFYNVLTRFEVPYVPVVSPPAPAVSFLPSMDVMLPGP